MFVSRRFLPSVSSLVALEAVDRLGTATAAAQELSLTHSAVSRQLKALEEQIGVRLFRRQGKGLTLTPAGIDYAASVRDYLLDLARASLKIRTAGNRSSLNLAVLPAFGTHWLLRRLRRFMDMHPDINVNIGTRLSPFDFARESFDAAIHFGGREWQGVDYLELAREEVIPGCAPVLLTQGVPRPESLLALPLLHLESRPGAWEDWFNRNGCQVERLRGMLFDQFSPMVEGAALGLGVVLLPRFLAEAEFARGRLSQAASGYTEVDGSYFFVWPQHRAVSRSLQIFLQWLEREKDQ
jgi:DNA-binding transcriptional LysR family regulator